MLEGATSIPQPAFRIRDSNVLLSDFTAEMVAQLPSAAECGSHSRSSDRAGAGRERTHRSDPDA